MLERRSHRWVHAVDNSGFRLIDWFPPLVILLFSLPQFTYAGDPHPLTVLLSLLLIVPLVFRRRNPILVFAIVCPVALAQWWTGDRVSGEDPSLVAFLSLLVAFYTVAALRSARVTAVAGVVLEAALTVLVVRWSVEQSPWLNFVLLSGLSTTSGVLGVYSQTRAAFLAQLRQHAERVERERDQDVLIAAADERARIARELHDIVAHHLTVMIALAEGAAAAVPSSPACATEAMTTVSATGRRALADTRRLLGVLRTEDSEDEQPALRILDRCEGLLARLRAAGLRVTTTMTGEHRELSPALQLTVYRLMQEALTNTLKHAGPGAHARVRLEYKDDGVSLDIRDDGVGSPASPAVGGQQRRHGLTGMRERVAAWDGELNVGPASPHGWVVTARLRTEPATDLVDSR